MTTQQSTTNIVEHIHFLITCAVQQLTFQRKTDRGITREGILSAFNKGAYDELVETGYFGTSFPSYDRCVDGLDRLSLDSIQRLLDVARVLKDLKNQITNEIKQPPKPLTAHETWLAQMGKRGQQTIDRLIGDAEETVQGLELLKEIESTNDEDKQTWADVRLKIANGNSFKKLTDDIFN